MTAIDLGISLTSPIGGAGGFSPLDLGPVLWLDASDTSTITESGGVVSQWDDKSGNGYDVTQGTAAAQPSSGTRTLNSLNVIDFGGNDYMQVAFGTTYTQPNTVFLVGQFDTGLSVTMFDGDDATNRNLFSYSSTEPAWRMFAGSSVTGGTADSNAHVFRLVYNGASSTGHVDAVATISGNPGGASIDGCTVGSNYAGTFNLDGFIAEVIVVDGTLTAGQIADTESYLANKWGITL